MEERRHRRRHHARQGHLPGTTRYTTTTATYDVPNSSYPSQLTNVNGTLFFTANDGTNGRELWKSDGTAAGTVMVKDINSAPQLDRLVLADVNGTLVLLGRRRRARPGAVEERRHRRRHRARQGHQPRRATARYIFDATILNGMLFFTAEPMRRKELWKSDGTAAGTVLVKDINPGRRQLPDAGSRSPEAHSTSPRLDELQNQELWKSDGTAAGTTLVKDFGPYSFLSLVDGRRRHSLLPVQ